MSEQFTSPARAAAVVIQHHPYQRPEYTCHTVCHAEGVPTSAFVTLPAVSLIRPGVVLLFLDRDDAVVSSVSDSAGLTWFEYDRGKTKNSIRDIYGATIPEWAE